MVPGNQSRALLPLAKSMTQCNIFFRNFIFLPDRAFFISQQNQALPLALSWTKCFGLLKSAINKINWNARSPENVLKGPLSHPHLYLPSSNLETPCRRKQKMDLNPCITFTSQVVLGHLIHLSFIWSDPALSFGFLNVKGELNVLSHKMFRRIKWGNYEAPSSTRILR